MLEVDATIYLGRRMEPYLKKVLEQRRLDYQIAFGCSADDDQELLDWIFEEAIEKECAKFGF